MDSGCTWLHRYLVSGEISNSIVDSSSIEVNRRRRRTKTDRLDACKLVTMLMRAAAGETRVWSVVKVPARAAEDQRQVHRELLFARRDRGRHTNRIKGLLASQGVPLERIQELPGHLERARLWDGTPVPALLRARLTREWETIRGYSARIRALKTERRALLKSTDDPAMAQVRELHQLRGVGIDSAWLYVMEFFAWREFRNRRQVGGLAGLTDTHYQSGDLQHGSPKRGTAGSARSRSTPRGPGCAFNPRARCPAGTKRGLDTAPVAFARSASSPWRGSC